MNIKRFITPLLLIILLASIVVFGAPNYGNVGPTTEFGFDIKIEDEIVAEGSSADDHETTILFTDPTADRTITVPDSDQTVGTASSVGEDIVDATALKDDNAPADEDVFCYELTGTTGHWYSRAEIGIGVATSITDNLILEADLNADEEPANNDILTFDETGANFSWQTKAELGIMSDTGDVGTGVYDFGGSTSFEIPNSATPSLTVAGQLAYDTTVTGLTNGCLSYYGGDIRYVVDLDTLPVDDTYVVAYNSTTDKFYMKADATGAGGSAIVFDIGDDGGNDSTDVNEIATSGDTNSIFTEPAPDKILINLANNWPVADLATLATTITVTDNESTAENNPICFVAGADPDGGSLGIETDGDLHYNPSTGLVTATGFAGNFKTIITTKTGTATLTVVEAGTVLVSAASAYTLTLPTAVGNAGLQYHFIKTDYNYNLITLDGDGTETFNYENSTGAAVQTYPRLNTPLAQATIVSDGSNWQVRGEELGQVPECWVYLSAHQLNFTHNTWLFIDLNAEDFDIGDNFDYSTWVSGNATSTSASHLIDSGGSFTAVMVGHRVKNTTDTTYTYITAYNSATDVTVRDDIFVDTEGYEIKNAKFVAPVAGKYLISYGVNLHSTGLVANKRYIAGIHQNTTDVMQANMILASPDYCDINKTFIVSASKDDAFWCRFYSGSGDNAVDVFGSEKQHTYSQIKLISKD